MTREHQRRVAGNFKYAVLITSRAVHPYDYMGWTSCRPFREGLVGKNSLGECMDLIQLLLFKDSGPEMKSIVLIEPSEKWIASPVHAVWRKVLILHDWNCHEEEQSDLFKLFLKGLKMPDDASLYESLNVELELM